MTKRRVFSILIALLVALMACSLVTGEVIEPEVPAVETNLPSDAATLHPTSPTSEEPTSPPPPTQEALATPERTPDRVPEFGVILVSEGDVLNVRSGPGVENGIIDTLDPHAIGITMTGNRQKVDTSMWVEIETLSGTMGWVNAHFLTEIVDNNVFCDDPEVTSLIDKFISAIQTRDGNVASQLVSPIDGLTIRVSWWNPEVTFSAKEMNRIFENPATYDWGTQDGSGFPIQGTFSDEILPWMDDILNVEYSQHCNDLDNGSGPSAGFVIWPFEYQNINYFAIYRSAPADQELDWRTWAIGISYHKGKPYIAFMVQYHWEI
ncbi:MAG: SH3 domain-containing protein [Anaerolineales bacterium]|nr:SH3 domain-containing protein [Chloroflexota bacterium]MBL6980295.1 SH3 domain-containing protein [Anaerolineales bacterium]